MKSFMENWLIGRFVDRIKAAIKRVSKRIDNALDGVRLLIKLAAVNLVLLVLVFIFLIGYHT